MKNLPDTSPTVRSIEALEGNAARFTFENGGSVVISPTLPGTPIEKRPVLSMEEPGEPYVYFFRTLDGPAETDAYRVPRHLEGLLSYALEYVPQITPVLCVVELTPDAFNLEGYDRRSRSTFTLTVPRAGLTADLDTSTAPALVTLSSQGRVFRFEADTHTPADRAMLAALGCPVSLN